MKLLESGALFYASSYGGIREYKYEKYRSSVEAAEYYNVPGYTFRAADIEGSDRWKIVKENKK